MCLFRYEVVWLGIYQSIEDCPFKLKASLDGAVIPNCRSMHKIPAHSGPVQLALIIKLAWPKVT